LSSDIQVDESVFHSDNSVAQESLKKIKKSRVDQNRLREVSERAFQFVENRDRAGLVRHFEQNQTVPIVDMVDHRGYTLMHMICFKNLEELALEVIEVVKQRITEKQIK
jgi:hypothetical protein